MRLIPHEAHYAEKMRVFAGKHRRCDGATRPQSTELSPRQFFAMNGLGSSTRFRSLPNEGFGHAIGKSYCNLGFRRRTHRLDVCGQLGWTGASRLLSRNATVTASCFDVSAVASFGFLVSKRRQ
jgi:hypothetical protein